MFRHFIEKVSTFIKLEGLQTWLASEIFAALCRQIERAVSNRIALEIND